MSERHAPHLQPDPTRLAQFRIEHRLGVGGMGIVYRAMDERLKRAVALKVLPSAFADPERRRRFLREARSAAAITHPNIATVYDIGEAEEHIFIAMELIEGETLRARIERGLSVAESLDVARDVARGLGRAHQKGIVHRDLKPENIMISHHGEVKILDFGLAKAVEVDLAQLSTLLNGQTEENLTVEGRVVGTPAYMSPEQSMGETVDATTDVFAFGIVFFEMLTGTRPFQGATAIAVMMAAARDVPKRPSELNPMVPVEVDRIVGRCLEKLSAGRYANGDDLRTALEAVEASRTSLSGATTISASPGTARSGPPASGPPSGRRGATRLRVLGAALAAAPVLAVATWALGPKREAPEATTTSSSASMPTKAASVIGLLDSPLPVTKSPEALAEYRRAMTDIRDAVRPPQTALQRAVQLDPEFAAAHLRLSMWKLPPASTNEYGDALRFRDSLDARDQEILNAEEPAATGVPPDLGEAERRYAALAQVRPTDVEILLRLATLRDSRDPASARGTFHDLLVLSPATPGIELAAGDNERNADYLEAASQHYEQCLVLSSGATRCLSRLARLRASNGQCDAYQREVTRILVLQPDDWFFRRDGLSAALTTGVSDDGVRAAIAGVLGTDNPSLKRFDRELLDGEVALWRGSMLDAQAAFGRAEHLAPDQGVPTALSWTLRQRLAISEELGDAESVRSSLRAYMGARVLTTENAFDDIVLAGLRRYRVLPDAEITKLRDRWRMDATNTSASLLWLNYEAGLALTDEEARDVLASAPELHLGHDRLDVNARLGHVLLLARRFGDAASRLELVARNCAIFHYDGSDTVFIVPAAFELGQAREGVGDVPAACAAYQRVLDVWGKATPRSKTAAAARVRRRAIGCADAD
jgi:serine/threonine protein kinase